MFEANFDTEESDYYDFVNANQWTETYFDDDEFLDDDGSAGFTYDAIAWKEEGSEELHYDEFEWIMNKFEQSCDKDETCMALVKDRGASQFWRAASVVRKRRRR